MADISNIAGITNEENGVVYIPKFVVDNLVKGMTEPSEQNQRRQMKRMIKRFIVWYLKRHNVTFEYNNYVVRMFSKGYYDKLMQSANDMRKEDEGK